MGKVRIKLVCMNGGGISPGVEITHFLDNDDAEDTYIVQTSERAFTFCDDREEVDFEAVDVLARLSNIRKAAVTKSSDGPVVLTWLSESSSSFNIVFEPLANGVFIESALSPSLSGLFDSDRIGVPPTSEGERHFIHLRPDDIINFSDHGLKVAVMAEIPDSTSDEKLSSDSNIVIAKQLQAEVQVKSSNAESDPANTSGDLDDATDSSDDDLDQPLSDRTAKTTAVGEITPATSRTVGQTIMETPHATTKNDSNPLANADHAPYSIAQEAPASDTAMLGIDNAASPTAQAQLKRAAAVDSLKDSPLAPVETAWGNSTTSDSDAEIEHDSPKVMKKYGRQQNRRAPSTSPDPAATSEYEAREVAFAAASGSMAGLGTESGSLSSSTKRKASDIGEEQDLSVSSKKRKIDTPKVVEEQYDEPQDGASDDVEPTAEIDGTNLKEEEEDEEDTEPDVKAAPTRKKGRPARSARQTKSTSPTGSKPSNSSPVVVVAARRTTKKRTSTKSPPSSAASSVLTGKVPHILLSSDSACRKGATAAFLKKQGATIIDDVKTRRTHFVCVLKGDRLTTTAKVLRSLALGKLVVTEDWTTESKKAGHLLEPDDFVHEDLQPTINVDRRTIFQDKNLFFTKTLVKAYGKGWKDIQELAKEAGASHIEDGDSDSFGHLKLRKQGAWKSFVSAKRVMIMMCHGSRRVTVSRSITRTCLRRVFSKARWTLMGRSMFCRVNVMMRAVVMMMETCAR
jgi:hypothetical protein